MGVESAGRLGRTLLGGAHDRRTGRFDVCGIYRVRNASAWDSAFDRLVFEGACLAGLLFAAICAQVIVPMGAPAGYDLTKWASVNYLPGSAGYFQVARQKAAADPWKFLAEYPDWIRSQDVFHIGTHPPGLIAAQCLLLRTMDQNPRLTGALLAHMPPSVEAGFRVFDEPGRNSLTRAERATLYATALLTLFACAGTVVPLYLLARAALPASASWAAAALWPLATAANLFQPVADTGYPLLSTSALALAAWAARSHLEAGRSNFMPELLAFLSGVVMALGMSFTLAFLPVGLIVAFTLVGTLSISWRTRAFLIVATGRRLSWRRSRDRMGAHRRQSFRHRFVEPQAPCAVLCRVPEKLSTLALGKPGRDGDRSRRAVCHLVRGRVPRSTNRSGPDVVDAAGACCDQPDRPQHGRGGTALDAVHAAVTGRSGRGDESR